MSPPQNFLEPPEKSAQVEGREFEDLFAKTIGGEPIKMSGAGFTKQDVNGGLVLWQLKSTRGKAFPVSSELFKGIDAAINGPGGIGGDVVAGVAARAADGEVICCFRLNDLLRIQDAGHAIAPSKSYNVDLSKRTPTLLQDDD